MQISGSSRTSEAATTVRDLARALERTRGVRAAHPSESLARTVLASDVAEPRARARVAEVARRIGEALEATARPKRRAEHAVFARRLFDALGLGARPGPGAAACLALDGKPRSLALAELDAFARDARDEQRLDATLDAYEAAATRLSLDLPLPLDAFLGELDGALRTARDRDASADAPAPRAIRICTLRDLPPGPFDLLVLGDLHEGALSQEERAAALVDVSTRAELTRAIEPALRACASSAGDAALVRLADAASGAARVVVSSATRDETGTVRPPHPLIAWLERRSARQTIWREQVLVDRPLTAAERRLRALHGGGTEARSSCVMASERAWIETGRERAFGLSSGEAQAGPDFADEALQAILTEETGGGERAMSVSALDRFGACRFQGFASEVLGAKSRPILPDVVGAREDGTLLHGALAAAFAATRALWSARPRDAGAIRDASRRAASDFLRRDAAATRVLRATLDDIADRVARAIDWSLADEEWDFAHAEAPFGKGSDAWRAVVLGDDRTRLELRGSIDRVDASHDGRRLRVIDYKRSEDGARRATDALGESGFQLAVYARAASLTLGKPVDAGIYLQTRHLSPGYRSRQADAAWARAHDLDRGLPRFEQRALDLVHQARRGALEPQPASAAACRYCDLDGACRKPRFVIESAIVDDPDDARAGM
jgi:hypothetical protein